MILPIQNIRLQSMYEVVKAIVVKLPRGAWINTAQIHRLITPLEVIHEEGLSLKSRYPDHEKRGMYFCNSQSIASALRRLAKEKRLIHKYGWELAELPPNLSRSCAYFQKP